MPPRWSRHRFPQRNSKANVLHVIEQELGRVRTADKNAPRTIDLDIALFNDEVLDVGARHIPDPDIIKHAHVSVPLADVAPEYRHPETGQTLWEIADRASTGKIVRRDDIGFSEQEAGSRRQEFVAANCTKSLIFQ